MDIEEYISTIENIISESENQLYVDFSNLLKPPSGYRLSLYRFNGHRLALYIEKNENDIWCTYNFIDIDSKKELILSPYITIFKDYSRNAFSKISSVDQLTIYPLDSSYLDLTVYPYSKTIIKTPTLKAKQVIFTNKNKYLLVDLVNPRSLIKIEYAKSPNMEVDIIKQGSSSLLISDKDKKPGKSENSLKNTKKEVDIGVVSVEETDKELKVYNGDAIFFSLNNNHYYQFQFPQKNYPDAIEFLFVDYVKGGLAWTSSIIPDKAKEYVILNSFKGEKTDNQIFQKRIFSLILKKEELAGQKINISSFPKRHHLDFLAVYYRERMTITNISPQDKMAKKRLWKPLMFFEGSTNGSGKWVVAKLKPEG